MKVKEPTTSFWGHLLTRLEIRRLGNLRFSTFGLGPQSEIISLSALLGYLQYAMTTRGHCAGLQ